MTNYRVQCEKPLRTKDQYKSITLIYFLPVIPCYYVLYLYVCIKRVSMDRPALCLEAGMKSHQEGMVGSLLKHMLFCLNPVNILKNNNEKNKHTHTHKNQSPIEKQSILSVSRETFGRTFRTVSSRSASRLKTDKGLKDRGTRSFQGAAPGCEETHNGQIQSEKLGPFIDSLVKIPLTVRLA